MAGVSKLVIAGVRRSARQREHCRKPVSVRSHGAGLLHIARESTASSSRGVCQLIGRPGACRRSALPAREDRKRLDGTKHGDRAGAGGAAADWSALMNKNGVQAAGARRCPRCWSIADVGRALLSTFDDVRQAIEP